MIEFEKVGYPRRPDGPHFSKILAALGRKQPGDPREPHRKRIFTTLTLKSIVDEFGQTPQLLALLLSRGALAVPEEIAALEGLEEMSLRTKLDSSPSENWLPIMTLPGHSAEGFLNHLRREEPTLYRRIGQELLKLQDMPELVGCLYDPSETISSAA
jgi:hypothetical protein